MPKRFTDTSIWAKPWYRKLQPAEKLAWNYIKDNCDNVGVWDADMELAEFCIGAKVDWAQLLEGANGNIQVLENGKWWLCDFCSFQYGRLTERCVPHKSYLALLEKHGIRLLSAENTADHRVQIPFTKGTDKAQDKDKEKDKEKDKDKEPPKTRVAEGVLLSEEQVAKLKARFPDYDERIQSYSLSKMAHGYKYKSDYHAILTWARNDKPAPKKPKTDDRLKHCENCGDDFQDPSSICPKCGYAWSPPPKEAS